MINIHKIWMVVNAFQGMKVIAFRNVTTTCSLVDAYKHFGGTCCLHFRPGCHDTERAYSTEKLVLCGGSLHCTGSTGTKTACS